MGKKAQAMSDFLITYGWAILVVLVVVGALAGLSQLGIIRSDTSFPEACTMRVGLACIDHVIRPDKASLTLVNGIGKDINIINISIGGNCSESFNKNFDRGETITFELFGCNNGKRLNRFEEGVTIYYKDKGRWIVKKTEGTIVAQVS